MPAPSAVRPQYSRQQLVAANITNPMTCNFYAQPTQLDGTNAEKVGL
jgi:hypothetical protein